MTTRGNLLYAKPTTSNANMLKVLAFPRNSKNPYLDLLYSAVEKYGTTVRNGDFREILSGDYDVVHYHWPEAFLNRPAWWQRWRAFIKYLLIFAIIKVRRKKSVWTVHDIKPHEEQGKLLPRCFRLLFFGTINGLIVLSDTAYQLTVARYPTLGNKPVLHSWHGHYRTLYPHVPTKGEAKEQVGIAQEQFIIGFFGSIRPYKNVPHLLRTFRQLSDKRLRLHVWGLCLEKSLADELVALANDDPRIKLELDFVPESKIPWALGAIDLMVLPFVDTLNSGSTLLSLSLNVPVLVPAKGSLLDLVQAVGPTWVRTYADILTPAILAEAIEWATMPRSSPAPLDRFAWESCGKETADFLRAIANVDD